MCRIKDVLMNKCVILFLFCCVLLIPSIQASGQTKTEHAAWLFLSAEQSLSKKCALSADVQARSATHLDYLTVLLLRPGLVYKITEKQSATVGYAYSGSWEKEAGAKTYTLENRIWEQYEVDGRVGRIELTNRLRLEQRFIQKEKDVFAQRLRYFIKTRIPLATDKDFTKGWYAGLQNELFLNVQNKENINNKTFDQNRLNGALGYRFSKSWDVEAGYLYR